MAGRLELITIESEALKGNRLDDPYVRQLAVYLPEGYDEGTEAYPVIYFLSAHGRTHYYYINWNQYDETVPQRLDRLIGSGQMPPTIVVFPDDWTRFGGSQFIDSPIGGYETYLIDEIVPIVDERYRTIPNREQRGLIGHSSGGYGALYHAMTNADIFGAVAAKAPDAYFEYNALPALSRFHQQVEKYGGVEAFIAQIPDIHPKKGGFWEAIHTAMYAMAYGANPAAPAGFDSPIDSETGALNTDVWERWLQFDPVRMLENSVHQNALRQMALIFLEVGMYDQYQLQVGARVLHKKMLEFNIEHDYEEFPDGHSSTSYRFDISLPKLAKAIER